MSTAVADVQRQRRQDRGSDESDLCPPHGNQQRATEIRHGNGGKRERERDQANCRIGIPGQPFDRTERVDEERWMVVPIGRDVVGLDVATPEIGIGGIPLGGEAGHCQAGGHEFPDRPGADVEVVRQEPAPRRANVVHFAAIEKTIESRKSDQHGDDEDQRKGPNRPMAHARSIRRSGRFRSPG